MKINFTAKNQKIPGALKGYVETKIESLEKISGTIINAEVILSEEGNSNKAEIMLKTKNSSFHAIGEEKILKQAIKSALDKIKSQAKKEKEKNSGQNSRKKIKLISLEQETSKDVSNEEEQNIIISENVSSKPISVDEALIFLEESGDNAFGFINIDTEKFTVIYKNTNKGISIIEAE